MIETLCLPHIQDEKILRKTVTCENSFLSECYLHTNITYFTIQLIHLPHIHTPFLLCFSEKNSHKKHILPIFPFSVLQPVQLSSNPRFPPLIYFMYSIETEYQFHPTLRWEGPTYKGYTSCLPCFE